MEASQVIYFVDDDPLANRLFERSCSETGHDCEVFTSATKCLKRTKQKPPALVITDLNMPHTDGFSLISELSTLSPGLPVVALTGQSTVDRVVQAMRIGASDFLRKPYETHELAQVIERCMSARGGCAPPAVPTSEKRCPESEYGMVGQSRAMRTVYKLIDRLAKVDCSVIISGESGTGKELAARAIHQRGPRAKEPFVAIDCGAVTDSLLESELFGHVRGAFTGADRHRAGRLEMAGRGTVFFDEIGNISSAMQAKLLRVIQERTVTPVGSHREIPIRARFLVASNRDLSSMVEKDEFRHDLYHRLNVVELVMPTLRDRQTDIPALIEYCVREFSERYQQANKHFSSAVIKHLVHQPWPGNVRELRNFVERCVVMSVGESLDSAVDMSSLCSSADACGEGMFNFTPNIPLREIELAYIREVLTSVEGNQGKAADILGINRSTLWRKMNVLAH